VLALRVVAKRCQEREAADDASVLPALVAAMRVHAANADIREQACRALMSITTGDDAQGEACAQAAVDAGALPHIVAAMHVHAANAAVQDQACRALINIAAGNDAHRDARRQAAADAGALPQIIATMHAHAANATVQEQGRFARRLLGGMHDAMLSRLCQLDRQAWQPMRQLCSSYANAPVSCCSRMHDAQNPILSPPLDRQQASPAYSDTCHSTSQFPA